MHVCSFELNDKPMSSFRAGALSFDAFSGLAPFTNKKTAACLANAGPIPPGTYYILDRESGDCLALYGIASRARQTGWHCMQWTTGLMTSLTVTKLNVAIFDCTPKAPTE